MSKGILMIAVLLIACNTNKNLVSSPKYNLNIKLPSKGRLLSTDEAKRFHENIDLDYLSYTNYLRYSSNYLVGNVIINIESQKRPYETNEKTGIKEAWTMKTWSGQKINVYGSKLKNFRKGNINDIEYLTYNLDFDDKREKVPKHLRDIMVLQGHTMCEIEVVSLPKDSLNSKKVFDYIIKHLQINKDTLVQSH